MCFLKKQERGFRDNSEEKVSVNQRENYLELVEVLYKQEQYIRNHYKSTVMLKHASICGMSYLNL